MEFPSGKFTGEQALNAFKESCRLMKSRGVKCGAFYKLPFMYLHRTCGLNCCEGKVHSI